MTERGARRPWGRYPVAALGLLAAVDGFHGYAVLVLGPDIARTLGVGVGTVATIGVLSMVATSLAALPLAALVRGGRRRAAASLTGAGAWSATSLLASAVTGPWGLAAVAAMDGASTATVRTLHPALLADGYPAGARVRVLAAHRALDMLGMAAAPLAVAVLAASGLTWRGVLVGVAATGAVAALLAVRVRDPGLPGDEAPAPAAVRPTVGEAARALLAVPSVRRILLSKALLGALLAPLLAYLLFHFEGRWGLDATGRGACLATAGAAAVLALALLAGEGERRLRRGPAALVAVLWPLLVVVAAALPVAVLTGSFGLMLAAFCTAFAALALVQAGTLALLMTLVTPEDRPQAAALAGIALGGIGGLSGLLLLGSVAAEAGPSVAMLSLAAPGAAAALALRAAGRTADGDLERLRTDAAAMSRAPEHGRVLLEAHGVAARYDHRRVLDDVDLVLDDGEVIAVLGTNGAGKSTLLRALSGMLPPAAGRVRYDGHDVTYLDPERRAALGIAHVVAGGGCFAGMPVRDGLRVAALAAGLGRAAESAVDEMLERFPELGRRSSVRAAELSAGERRLLGIAQALLQRPRLVLGDELTRGLAPATAEAVLALLRATAREGTAMVLVEQSLDRAAAVAARACFLERGRVRFDGPVEALADRHDLLRPVFLTAARAAGGVPT